MSNLNHVKEKPEKNSHDGDEAYSRENIHQHVNGIPESIFNNGFADDINGTCRLEFDQCEPSKAPSLRYWIGVGFAISMSIAMIAAGIVAATSSYQKASTLASVQARLAQSSDTRAQILETWIENYVLLSRRLTESEIFRQYINDLSVEPVDSPLPRSLLDQRPYFQTFLSEFVDQIDLARAAIIDRNGRFLLSSRGPALNVPDVLKRIGGLPIGWQSAVTSFRSIDSDQESFVVDILIPVPKSQTVIQDDETAEAILTLTIPMDSILTKTLKVPPEKNDTESLYIVYQKDDGLAKIGLGKASFELHRTVPMEVLVPGENLNFGRWFDDNGRSYFSSGEPIEGVPWTIIHAIDAREAVKPVSFFILMSSAIAIIIVLFISLLFSMILWRRTAAHHVELNLLHRSMLGRLYRQHSFLRVITNSVGDWLTITDRDNHYIYANSSFCSAVGISEDRITSGIQNELLTCNKYSATSEECDDLAFDGQIEKIKINGMDHFIRRTTSDIVDEQGRSTATVTIMRDETELVLQQQSKNHCLTQTINALVHAIERYDPFLHGHASRLRRYAIAIGRRLELTNIELSGLALAASLSQLGKIFVPSEVLIKPELHSRQDVAIMRGHMDHAISILEKIDFGLPVAEILVQMHERLDGSGYPKGLVDTDISLAGRILAVSDTFCAKTEPRYYQNRLGAGKALYHLATSNKRYDIKVIATLAEVIAEKNDIDPNKEVDIGLFDSQLWMNNRTHARSEMKAVA